MSKLDFTIGPRLGHRANLGLIVLRTDETLEFEARRILLGDGVAHYVSRVPCQSTVTLDALAEMEAEIPRAVSLLPYEHPFDVIGYACTSGATRIGPEKVDAAIRKGARTTHTTNPLTAMIAATRALDIRRIGFVTPYLPEVSQAMRNRLEEAGLEIAGFGSMEEERDSRVARIDARSILEAIRTVAQARPCDAVFLSCTNLRALDLIAPLEAELGIHVLTSNQVLLWHMLEIAGQPNNDAPYGALMRTRLPPRWHPDRQTRACSLITE
ncbi:MAG: aspartate/glutamate racemase family protein [Vannielia sp.]|uniref:maleate cis-trans isomerase family protein n=1 Tax=Vannielia sp. TaxID=2813045 RepID=UPI003B8B0AE5